MPQTGGLDGRRLIRGPARLDVAHVNKTGSRLKTVSLRIRNYSSPPRRDAQPGVALLLLLLLLPAHTSRVATAHGSPRDAPPPVHSKEAAEAAA